MNSNEILTTDIIDILFEGKNKAYGAYDLRKTYNKRITIALGSMIAICLLFSFSQLIAKNNDHVAKSIPTTVITLADLDETVIEKPKPLPVPPPHVQPTVVNTRIYTAPLLTNTDVVDVPPVEELIISKIGLETIVGTDDVGFITPPVEKSIAAEITPAKSDEDYTKTFRKVEHEAKFPGGLDAWKKIFGKKFKCKHCSRQWSTCRFVYGYGSICS